MTEFQPPTLQQGIRAFETALSYETCVELAAVSPFRMCFPKPPEGAIVQSWHCNRSQHRHTVQYSSIAIIVISIIIQLKE